MQVELDSGKRVKVKAANVLLRFEQAGAGRADGRRRRRWPPRSTSTWPGNSRPRASSASPTWRATTSTPRPAPSSRPRRCSACSTRRTTSAAWARASSRRRPRRPSRPRCWASSARSRSPRRSTPGPPNWSPAAARRRCASSSTRSCSSPTRTRPNTRPWSRPRKRAQRAPLDLLKAAGAIDSPYQFHWRRFLFEQFPKGTGFPRAARRRRSRTTLPLAPVQAFSIDDSATTEIDDALSVQGLGSGTVIFGIHIAAPGLAIAPDSPLDKVARDRLSTVYMPGWQAHDAARRRRAGLHADRGPRLPGGAACT